MGPKIRQNADIIACTYQTQRRAIDSIYEDYADIVGDKNYFIELLRQNTIDHKMFIIEQSEAHYDVKDMFFVSKAKEKVKPFKIGGAKFWKESGNNWEQQLEKYNNIPKKDKEDWNKAIKLREKEDKQEEQYEEEEENNKIETNQPDLLPTELKENYWEMRKKELGLEESTISKVTKKLKEGFGRYIPQNNNK